MMKISRRSFLAVGAASLVDSPTQAFEFQKHDEMLARHMGVVNGYERWAYRSKLVNQAADYVAVTEYLIDVLLPDDYFYTDRRYPVIFVAPVEATPIKYGNGLARVRELGLHNSRKCIFASMTTKTAHWFGSRSDGTICIDRHIIMGVMPLIDANYRTLKDRESKLWLGFSKSGWGGLSLALRNPQAFGYIAAWDCPWLLTYSMFDVANSFGTEAQFDLYNPLTIISQHKNAISDRSRLWIGGGNYWDTHFQPMLGALNSHSIPYRQHYQLAPSHNWLDQWVTIAVAALFEMRASQ